MTRIVIPKVFSPKNMADLAALRAAGRPVMKSADDPAFLEGYLDLGLGVESPYAGIISSRFPVTPVNNPSRVPLDVLTDPRGRAVQVRAASVGKRERRKLRAAGVEPTFTNYVPPTPEELAFNFAALQQAVRPLDINPLLYGHGVVEHSPSLMSLVAEGKPITSAVRSAGGDIPNWVKGATPDEMFVEKLAKVAQTTGKVKTTKAAKELARQLSMTRRG